LPIHSKGKQRAAAVFRSFEVILRFFRVIEKAKTDQYTLHMFSASNYHINESYQSIWIFLPDIQFEAEKMVKLKELFF